jgi:hypothetical protein
VTHEQVLVGPGAHQFSVDGAIPILKSDSTSCYGPSAMRPSQLMARKLGQSRMAVVAPPPPFSLAGVSQTLPTIWARIISWRTRGLQLGDLAGQVLFAGAHTGVSEVHGIALFCRCDNKASDSTFSLASNCGKSRNLSFPPRPRWPRVAASLDGPRPRRRVSRPHAHSS